jgi:hypothetical protein
LPQTVVGLGKGTTSEAAKKLDVAFDFQRCGNGIVLNSLSPLRSRFIGRE